MIKSKLAVFAFAAIAAGNAHASLLFLSNTYVNLGYVVNENPANYAQDYEPGVRFSSIGLSAGGVTDNALANLSTGQLKVLNRGAVGPNFGNVNTDAEALLGDTITSSGSVGGLNLGVNIAVSGATTSDNINDNSTYLEITAFTPGTFATNGFFNSANVLFETGYSLGTGSQSSPSLRFGGTAAGHFLDGISNLSVAIPFSTLPSTFELTVALRSSEIGSSQNWNSDYSHTLNVALSAPAGINLTSASGTFPGTVTSTPEPGTFALGLPILAAVAFRCRKKLAR